jgi:alkylation response protein AidB-like acyl-CoA dehydrogenase
MWSSFSAETLERDLGDPTDSNSIISFARSVELDERDEYPEDACLALNQLGFNQFYVVAGAGGKLVDFTELQSLLRVVARRDFTVAWAHGMNTMLGGVNIWVGGSDTQRARLAQLIKDGEQIAVGYHEKEHGSDLLSAEVEAVKAAGGYLLSGEKWVIGNATRGAALTVFARTNPSGGPRGFSLFLVEKSQLDPACFTCLPKIKTHGIRGADISGIRFQDAFVSDQALIGYEGAGLELTLKSFQITRSLFPALSLGAADTALRTTVRFAHSRRLYGRDVFAIPQARKLLVDAFIDLLIGDCVAIAAARALHVAPDQTTMWSAVAKYYVPKTVDEVIKSLSVALGARHYLREAHDCGIFQKMMRDSAVVSMGHAGSFINLATITQNLAKCVERRARRNASGTSSTSGDERQAATLAALFNIENPLPAFDPNKLNLFNNGRDDIIAGVESSLESLSNREPAVSGATQDNLISLTTLLRAEVDRRDATLSELMVKYGSGLSEEPEMFDLAERHCTLHAAATCLHMWLYNRKHPGEFFAQGEWLVLCLERLLSPFKQLDAQLTAAYEANLANELVRLFDADQLFSIIPIQLATSSKNTVVAA